MEGQYPEWWRKKGNIGSGNTSSNQSVKAPTTNQKPTANVAMVPTAPFTSSDADDNSQFYAFITNASILAPMHTTYADSAASDHFFIDIADFESYEPYTGKNGSTTENGRNFTIYGKGNVRKHCVYDGKVITLLFKDALHCPTVVIIAKQPN